MRGAILTAQIAAPQILCQRNADITSSAARRIDIAANERRFHAMQSLDALATTATH
jgi:hypothetical protein